MGTPSALQYVFPRPSSTFPLEPCNELSDEEKPTGLVMRCVMFDVSCMRTTVNLDDDVLRAARELAALSDRTLGEVISDLVRQGLARSREEGETEAPVRNGVPVLKTVTGAGVVTSEDVDRLLDEA